MKREYLPLDTLPSWVRLNGITTDGVAFRKLAPTTDDDGADKGTAIVATEERMNASEEGGGVTGDILLSVPSDMVLSLQMVETHAKTDRYLREVLDAVGEFGRTARGAILIFLIMQITHSSPDFTAEPHKIGVSNPWSEYVKYMPPSITLPTFYTEEELELLRGTSLQLAVDAKVISLEKEFEHLRKSTESISWCEKLWWDEETGRFTFDDWRYVDAVYRSRMVDLPSGGHAMVPCVDMANHASDDAVKALYDEDVEGNAVLRLRWGKKLNAGDEVTISYGNEKPASEMVFSYGFLDPERTAANQVFVGLDIPDDDPLKMAKMTFYKGAPGVRMLSPPASSETQSTGWDSPFVWWACVNEEDGLDFNVLQTNDGGRELRASWKGEEVDLSGDLRNCLATDPLWDVFQLRAVVTILDRLETQFFTLQQSQVMIAEISQDESMREIFRPDVFGTVMRLRELEAKMLEKAIEDLAKQRDDLMTTETVSAYLNSQQSGDIEEDFS
ncbi:hypothetical protein N8T08_002953 [Aspergillus melleus]|uniref:Uncharacterized protein n=1 Tax=Aspergillus melleus TaxID=138277 RepID=A0ACC3B821_9EURO|nr:hypothetical protein N8T08_002953 [Aspergillus melleus]